MAFAILTAAYLLGFVDGTENPSGDLAMESTIIGDEVRTFTGGSDVIVQKYLHDMTRWNMLDDQKQEQIIGRASFPILSWMMLSNPPGRTAP